MKSFLLFGIIIFLVSCSSRKELSDEETNGDFFVVNLAQPENYLSQDSKEQLYTRATDIGSGLTSTLSFEHGDTIGIFTSNGSQIFFVPDIPVGTYISTVTLRAEGWMTKLSNIYALYLPYDFYNREYDSIPWNGKKIIEQSANNSKIHIGKYWILGSDTVVQNNTDGIFHTSLKMLGTEVRVRAVVSAQNYYVKMVLVAPTKAFSSQGYYDLFDRTHGQPYYSTDSTDHVMLTIASPNLSAVGKSVIGYFYFPEVNLDNTTLGCYIWDKDGNCYYGTAGTGIYGNWTRNSVNDILFGSMSLVTTPKLNLNPWEEEDTCSTCYPVAF